MLINSAQLLSLKKYNSNNSTTQQLNNTQQINKSTNQHLNNTQQLNKSTTQQINKSTLLPDFLLLMQQFPLGHIGADTACQMASNTFDRLIQE